MNYIHNAIFKNIFLTVEYLCDTNVFSILTSFIPVELFVNWNWNFSKLFHQVLTFIILHLTTNQDKKLIFR